MGAPAGETLMSLSQDAGPQHTVTVNSFLVGKYEVTFNQWSACVNGGGCQDNPNPNDQGWGRGDRPVVNVSWDDAQEYVRWISRQTGRQYRLLTESEWEYAARAGTTTPYSTGSSMSARQARFNSDSTAPVGSYPSNLFGIYDMHGNVEEWVGDCYNSSYVGAPSNGTVWESGDCSMRIARGGNFGALDARSLHSARRDSQPRSTRFRGIGFRVARSL